MKKLFLACLIACGHSSPPIVPIIDIPPQAFPSPKPTSVLLSPEPLQVHFSIDLFSFGQQWHFFDPKIEHSTYCPATICAPVAHLDLPSSSDKEEALYYCDAIFPTSNQMSVVCRSRNGNSYQAPYVFCDGFSKYTVDVFFPDQRLGIHTECFVQ